MNQSPQPTTEKYLPFNHFILPELESVFGEEVVFRFLVLCVKISAIFKCTLAQAFESTLRVWRDIARCDDSEAVNVRIMAYGVALSGMEEEIQVRILNGQCRHIDTFRAFDSHTCFNCGMTFIKE